MDDKEAFDLIAAHAVPGAPSVQTIVALKSDEQASLSPGAYEVLTSAIERADHGPLSALRWELRQVLAACSSERCAPEIGKRLEAILNSDAWEVAALGDETLCRQLKYWKTFAIHAEGEHAAWKKTASELDAELGKLRLDRGLVERAADMLTAYAELIRRDGATHVEEHHYLPEVEHTATELRARFVFGA